MRNDIVLTVPQSGPLRLQTETRQDRKVYLLVGLSLFRKGHEHPHI